MLMVSGGAEASICPWGFIGFCANKAMSTRNDDPDTASRPFDKDRDGFVMGEGAGILILEEMEHAKKRNAHIYAEIVGYGATADAFHITAPRPDGTMVAKAMTIALNTANIKSDQIDYINAHGTSTRYNDLYETLAIKKAFGKKDTITIDNIAIDAASTTNIAVFIWNDDSTASTEGDSISIANVNLTQTSIAQDFKPRDITTELSLCNRYFWRAATGDRSVAFPGLTWSGSLRVLSRSRNR